MNEETGALKRTETWEIGETKRQGYRYMMVSLKNKFEVEIHSSYKDEESQEVEVLPWNIYFLH